MSGRSKLAAALLPVSRLYFQRAPWAAGKQAIWSALGCEWRGVDFVARTSWGGTFSGNTEDLVQRYVYYFGIWEPPLTDWMTRTLSGGDAFVDVGANIGYYSILAAKLVGDEGRVAAIEASPTIYSQLVANVARNHAGNVTTINAAATDKPGTCEVFLGASTNRGTTTIIRNPTGVRDLAEVEYVRGAALGELVDWALLKRARVIKIDVEGAEYSVLRGLLPVMSRLREDVEIVVEVCPEKLEAQGVTAEMLWAEMSSVGFHSYVLDNPYLPCDYFPPRGGHAPPTRASRIERFCDVVFSRVDAPRL